MTNKTKYTFFWDGIFSQWYAVRFADSKGNLYNCAEQYMMAQKALLFDDKEIFDKIMASHSPREQKKLGRQVKNFDQAIWEKHATKIVYDGNFFKFSQNPELLKQLLDTAGTILVEASPYDKIWGIGLAANDPRAQDEKQWLGQNLLGHQLTYLRNTFIVANKTQ